MPKKDKDKKKEENKLKKEEVCEIYEIENTKTDEEKTVKSCGNEIIKKGSEKEKENYNKILFRFLFVLGFLVLILGIWIIASYYQNYFDVEGIPFNIIQEGEITFYRTYLPLTDSKGQRVGEYNLYLRNDPRKINKNIPFEGEIIFIDKMYINSTKELFCQGYGTIAVENIANLYRRLGIDVKSGANISCDEGLRYTYLNIQKGNRTELKQTGPACYELTIKECEVLEGTEKFIIESLKAYGAKY